MLHVNIIEDLTQWIGNNLEKPLSINIIASKAGYSRWHLQRVFKSITGHSLAYYIRMQRLEHAAIELKQTKRSVAEIALKYQFDSQQSFARAFKKAYLQTPSAYRK